LEDGIARLKMEEDEQDEYFAYWNALTEEQLLVFRQDPEFKKAERLHRERKESWRDYVRTT